MTEPLTSGGGVVIISTAGAPGPPGPTGNPNLSVSISQPVNVPDNQVWVQIPQTPQSPPSVAGLATHVNGLSNTIGTDTVTLRNVGTVTGLTPFAVGTVWDSVAAGVQLLDILQLDGSAWTSGLIQNDAAGTVSMQVPITYTTWFLDYGTTRIRVTPVVVFPGAIRSGANTTGNRPSAVNAKVGAMFYDTTLHKPIWSDGTVWRDATGTAV